MTNSKAREETQPSRDEMIKWILKWGNFKNYDEASMYGWCLVDVMTIAQEWRDANPALVESPQSGFDVDQLAVIRQRLEHLREEFLVANKFDQAKCMLDAIKVVSFVRTEKTKAGLPNQESPRVGPADEGVVVRRKLKSLIVKVLGLRANTLQHFGNWYDEKSVREVKAFANQIDLDHDLDLTLISSDESGKSAKYWWDSCEDLHAKWHRNYCEMVEQKNNRIQQLEKANAELKAALKHDIDKIEAAYIQQIDELKAKLEESEESRDANILCFHETAQERDQLIEQLAAISAENKANTELADTLNKQLFKLSKQLDERSGR
jgi:hypothetical protein